MHKVAGTIEDAVGIPLLHLGDVTAAAVRAAGLDAWACSAPPSPCRRTSTAPRLESHGLQVLVPDEDDQTLVHRVIYDELCQGVVRDESRAAYVEVVDRLGSRGAQGIILGCTEIELLIGPDDLHVPSFAHHQHSRRQRLWPLPWTGPCFPGWLTERTDPWTGGGAGE